MIIYSVNPGDMSSLTDNDVLELISSLNRERSKRDAAKLDKAIAAFKQAYYNLIDLGITPKYQDDERDEDTKLRDWDCFYF